MAKSRGVLSLPVEMRARDFNAFGGRAIETDAILARFQAEKPPPNSEAHYKAHNTVTPVFSDRMEKVRGLNVLQTFEGAIAYLRMTVLPAFENLP